MKFLLVLTALFSMNAFAEVVVEKTPVYDLPVCREMNNVGKKDVVLSVLREEVKDDKRTITFKVDLYNCSEVPSGYGFRKVSPENDTYVFLMKNDKLVAATLSINSIKFYTYNASKELVIADVVKEGENNVVTLTIDAVQTKVGIGSSVNSDISYKNEILYAGLIESSRATYIAVK